MKAKLKKNYYSIREIADFFDVSDTTIRKQVLSGKIKSIKLGATYRISKEEFEKLFMKKLKDNVLVKT